MGNIAVIVDSRGVEQSLINAHMAHLDGWDLDVVSSHVIINSYDYNALLTAPFFWENYVDYERILIFQHDSMLMRSGIEEFLEWDYVGAPWFETAPWARKDRKGGNGGLSLRNPLAMLDCLRSFNYNSAAGNEDVFYVHNLDRCGWKVAPFEVCERFSCETIFTLKTIGWHQIDKHLTPDQISEIKHQYDNVQN